MNKNPPIFLDKKCSVCQKTKPLDQFGKRKAEKWRYENYNSQCKQCERNRKTGYMRTYRKKNPERVKKLERQWRENNPERYRSIKLKQIYGIDVKIYNEMLIAQNYECKICKTKHQAHSRESRLHIDHCHKSTKIRALLCTQCNKGLGHFRDNIEFLETAIAYLKHFA